MFPECRIAGNKTHYERLGEVANALPKIMTMMPRDAHILFVYSYYRVWNIWHLIDFDDIWGPAAGCKDLRGEIAHHANRFIIATADMDNRAGFKANFDLHKEARANYGMNPFESTNLSAIAIPYVASGLLEDHAYNQTSDCDAAFATARRTDIMFHGNTHRTHEGSFRGVVISAIKDEFGEAADVRNISLQVSWKEKKSMSLKEKKSQKKQNIKEITRSTARSMLASRYCLAPEGDVSTSRRPFDALAAGCIPIIFGTEIRNLPFWDTNYRKYFAIAGSLPCCARRENQQSFKRWIAATISSYNASKACMGTSAFRTTLSYRNGAVIENLVSVLASPSNCRRSLLVSFLQKLKPVWSETQKKKKTKNKSKSSIERPVN